MDIDFLGYQNLHRDFFLRLAGLNITCWTHRNIQFNQVPPLLYPTMPYTILLSAKRSADSGVLTIISASRIDGAASVLVLNMTR